MATYVIRGTIATAASGVHLNDLEVEAYKFLSGHTMQKFGTSAVTAGGDFELSIESTAPPFEVNVMPVPTILSPFGVFNIERSVPGLLFPKVHIAPGDWVLADGIYTKEVAINIPNYIWTMWAWLSEEFTVIGRLVKEEVDSFLPVAYAWVFAADADLPLPYGSGVGGAQTDELGNFVITFRRIGFFIDYGNYAPIWGKYGIEAWPNLIFHAQQKIAGIKTSIYSETELDARPQSDWDIPGRILMVELVTDQGITYDETYPAIPAGRNFLLHGIGLVDPDSLTEGYATTTAAHDLPNLKKCPFGGNLHIKGQFDTTGGAPPTHYQVLFAKWSGATPPAIADFQPILNESWTVSKYDSSTGDWAPLLIEPLSGIITGEKVYEIPDYTDITQNKKTRLITWTTTREDTGVARYPNGKYDLLVKAWDGSGNPVDLNPGHPEDNRMTVVIDNQRPKALLKQIGGHDILRTDEMLPYTPVCPIFSKATDGPTLAVRFDAIDEAGHLLKYHLRFLTGHNFQVDEFRKIFDGMSGANERFLVRQIHRPTPTSAEVVTVLLDELKAPGGFPDDTINWNIGSTDVVPCAYQVRLSVWGRTINGYGYIHYTEDTMHFSLES